MAETNVNDFAWYAFAISAKATTAS
jgi:hypothetical protein